MKYFIFKALKNNKRPRYYGFVELDTDKNDIKIMGYSDKEVRDLNKKLFNEIIEVIKNNKFILIKNGT